MQGSRHQREMCQSGAHLGLDDVAGAEAAVDLDLVDLRQPDVLQPAATSDPMLSMLRTCCLAEPQLGMLQRDDESTHLMTPVKIVSRGRSPTHRMSSDARRGLIRVTCNASSKCAMGAKSRKKGFGQVTQACVQMQAYGALRPTRAVTVSPGLGVPCRRPRRTTPTVGRCTAFTCAVSTLVHRIPEDRLRWQPR
jgi:hypothetical protein